ncbi:MAG: glycerophosphodiester phosphodiesterase, partial [Planctomycetota bacterium]
MQSHIQLAALLLIGLAIALRPPSASAQKIIAHRGASFDFPENTLVAFRHAWEQGADGIEGDFYLTADGQIVCIHDPDTERTGGQQLMVEQSTLEQLRGLEYGSWKDRRFAGESIPTLED